MDPIDLSDLYASYGMRQPGTLSRTKIPSNSPGSAGFKASDKARENSSHRSALVQSFKTPAINKSSGKLKDLDTEIHRMFSAFASSSDSIAKNELERLVSTSEKYLYGTESAFEDDFNKLKETSNFKSVRDLVGGDLKLSNKVTGLINLAKNDEKGKNPVAYALLAKIVVKFAKKNAALESKSKKIIPLDTQPYAKALNFKGMRDVYHEAFAHNIEKKVNKEKEQQRSNLHDFSKAEEFEDPDMYEGYHGF